MLGLPESKRSGQMPAAEFETGNLTIAVMQSDAFGIEFRANNHPVEFHVDDFEAAKAELESRGVEFKGDTLDSGVCWQAFFDDADGNLLAIHHRYAPPALHRRRPVDHSSALSSSSRLRSWRILALPRRRVQSCSSSATTSRAIK